MGQMKKGNECECQSLDKDIRCGMVWSLCLPKIDETTATVNLEILKISELEGKGIERIFKPILM
jgi:hypothetical protein